MSDEWDKWVEEELDDPNNHDLQPDEAAGMGWTACKKSVIKIIENTPLGYRTEEEHRLLELFADTIVNKIKNL